MNPSGNFIDDDGDADGIWEEVYVEQEFSFNWPSAVDTEGNPTGASVIDVVADTIADVAFDLLGVRGAYRMEDVFSPTINYTDNGPFSDLSTTYLYEYIADPSTFILVPYTLTYSDLTSITVTVRVWQDHNIGLNWILSRLAMEDARDTMIRQLLATDASIDAIQTAIDTNHAGSGGDALADLLSSINTNTGNSGSGGSGSGGGSGPPVTRLGDFCSGHGCWPPRPAITASDNVFVNGRGAVRVSDWYAVHCCKISNKCHPGQLAQGSNSVFVNNLPLGRIGDLVSCSSVAAQGSDNVFAGG